MQVKIHVYAKLKEFFSPVFSLELPERSTLNDLMQKISHLNPEANGSLNTCRIAVNETFVDSTYILNENENILLFPPSSGG